MEKVVFYNSRNGKLVGNHYPSSTETVIIMCHGFTSDKTSKGRFELLAGRFNKTGFSALAFDFSGCGESDDDELSLANEIDDLASAINYVKLIGYKKIALYGHSLGSLVCLKSYSPEITTIVCSGGLTDSMKYDWDAYFTKDQMLELNEKGYITQPINSSLRKNAIIHKQMLLDFELINQRQLLSAVKCPLLLIHGNKGWEEKLLCEKSLHGEKYLSADSKLEIIDGADHSFMEYLDRLVELTGSWFDKYLN